MKLKLIDLAFGYYPQPIGDGQNESAISTIAAGKIAGGRNAYNAQKSVRSVQKELELYEEVRKKLHEEHLGDLVEDDEQAQVAFQKAIQEVLNSEVDIKIHPISIEDVVGEVRGINIMRAWFMFTDVDSPGESAIEAEEALDEEITLDPRD